MALIKKTTAKKAASKKAGAGAPAKGFDFTKLVDLTPGEVKNLPKARPGFEEQIGPLLALYAAHPDELSIKALDIQELEGRFAAWNALAGVERSARKHLEMVEETRLLHSSKVWKQMLEIYAKAQAAARTNPDVARGIADFQKFMSVGPRKKPEKADK